MRLQIISDSHLEFDGPDFRRFISMLDPEGVDVLILAGDICTHTQVCDVISTLCKRYEASDVIYVHGNHEFYGTNRENVRQKMTEVTKHNKNLHWLDCSSVVIKGQRFLGAPLWFRDSDKNRDLEKFMNDFHVIDGLRDWVYDENAKAIDFIEQNVGNNDVVITHHLPSYMSVAPRFANGDLNLFFVCDMEQSIRSKGPKLWVHGHTHDAFDYIIPHSGNTIAETRVVCNPRGYFPNDLNPDFRLDFVVEV